MSKKGIIVKAVGDIVLNAEGRGLGSVPSLLEGADVVVGSLETPLSDRGVRAEKLFTFRSRPDRAHELAAAHFNVLSVANNHSMDYGWTALEDTIAALDAEGIRPIGAGTTIEQAMRPVFLDVGGTRLGFMGISTLLPNGMRARADCPGIAGLRIRTSYEVDAGALLEEPGLAPKIRTSVVEEDQAFLESLVATAAKECDVLFVVVHMGVGTASELLEFERPLAEALIRAGAACVLGGHVHTIRGAIANPQGMIVFGLSNFIGQQPRSGLTPEQYAVLRDMSSLSLIASIEITDGRCCAGTFSVIRGNSEGLPILPAPEETRAVLEGFKRQCAALGWKPEWIGVEGGLRWKI